MSKKETKETKVKDLKENNVAPKPPTLKLEQEDANAYLQILGLIMVGDDRLKSLQTHFVEMLKRNNEGLNEQSN